MASIQPYDESNLFGIFILNFIREEFFRVSGVEFHVPMFLPFLQAEQPPFNQISINGQMYQKDTAFTTTYIEKDGKTAIIIVFGEPSNGQIEHKLKPLLEG
jgi:hypothetical protein